MTLGHIRSSSTPMQAQADYRDTHRPCQHIYSEVVHPSRNRWRMERKITGPFFYETNHSGKVFGQAERWLVG
jgi:hypothetical protein